MVATVAVSQCFCAAWRLLRLIIAIYANRLLPSSGCIPRPDKLNIVLNMNNPLNIQYQRRLLKFPPKEDGAKTVQEVVSSITLSVPIIGQSATLKNFSRYGVWLTSQGINLTLLARSLILCCKPASACCFTLKTFCV